MSMIKSPGRTTQPSMPETRALADTVSRVRTVQIPRMRDQRSVTRQILDKLREDIGRTSIVPTDLADSRG